MLLRCLASEEHPGGLKTAIVKQFSMLTRLVFRTDLFLGRPRAGLDIIPLLLVDDRLTTSSSTMRVICMI